MTPEGQLKKDYRKYLDASPLISRIPVPANGYGKHGWPDDVVCRGGRFYAVEAKAPGKPPTPNQINRITELFNAGAWVTLAWSLEDVKNLFENGVGLIWVGSSVVKVDYKL